MRGDCYKRKFYCWAGIGTFFIYLGIDDNTSNEGVLGSLCDVFPSYTWQMVFGPFFMAIGIFIVWFLWKVLEPRRLWCWFLVGISLYAVAIGLDFVEGLDSEPYEGIAGFFSTEEYRIEHLSKTLEEFLEMLGTTIFLIVFLKNLFGLSGEWKITISEMS